MNRIVVSEKYEYVQYISYATLLSSLDDCGTLVSIFDDCGISVSVQGSFDEFLAEDQQKLKMVCAHPQIPH